MASHATLQAIDLDKLTLFPRNARRGDVPAIMASLRSNDQYTPITVNLGRLTGRPYEVLVGNHTLKAFRELADAAPGDERWSVIDCYVIDVDDTQATRINLNSNKLGQLGGFDDAQLAELLHEQVDLTGTGYTAQDLEELNALLGPMPSDITPEPVASEPIAGPAHEPGTETPADTSGPRSIALGNLPPQHRAWLHEKIEELRQTFNVDYPADVLIALIISHTGDRPE